MSIIRIADPTDRWLVERAPGAPTVALDLDPGGPDAQPACLPVESARALARALWRACADRPQIDLKRLQILHPPQEATP